MINQYKGTGFQLLFLITTSKLANKAESLFDERHIPMQYHVRAQGTASSDVMNMLGLDGGEKNLIMSMMPKAFAEEMLKKLYHKLHLGMPDSGIAFTVPMSGGSAHLIKLIGQMSPESSKTVSEREEYEMSECEYNMIMVIVNQGFSEDVMDAARPKGAAGGTVFHSRRIGSEEAMKFWGISVQPEREVVLILAKKEDKLPIMQAIGKKCGMQSEARGIVLSLPVDDVVGIDG